MIGRMVNVTRKVTSANVHRSTLLSRNSVPQSSWNVMRRECNGARPMHKAPGGRRSVDPLHPELLQLARQGIASPTQQLRRLLPVALSALERGADQHALEFRLRIIQQRPLAVHRLTIRPAGEGLGPVRLGGS